MQSREGTEEYCFVIEVCQDCKSHGWNTRHDESKYQEFFNRAERVPNSLIMRNQIPKPYLHHDLYCNLIHNEDPNLPYFQQVPRTGAFEVSYQGMLIFSKLQSGLWPNTELVVSKCAQIIDEHAAGRDVTPFLAGNSPYKGEGKSAKKPKRDGSPIKPFSQTGDFSQTTGSVQPPIMDSIEPPLRQAVVVEPEVQQSAPIDCGSHLQTPEALTGFPVFPAGTSSLLSKNLTEDVWNNLCDKADKFDFTFKQAILSGCQNVDSGIGVYAGSHDSYNAFSELMDPIIEQYHGHKKGDVHVSDMNHNNLKCPPLSAEDASMIISTRIRVGRNLQDFPLGPGVSREDRQMIEKHVIKAAQSFKGELSGKYYYLSTMSETDRQQLVADHFLFKEGDRFLQACGLNRNWPEGRGIFHNNDKTFLIWVNEEDQLRIISMQPGADIGAVFTRLSKACSIIDEQAKFSHDKNLGYITSCPTNLGTALRASVHIKLPCLGERKDEFEAIAAKYHVQIRGIHGEHSESADHIYDISNRRRLGRSEVALVQDMYDGVKAMIEREKELAGPKVAADVQAGPHLKTPEDITGYPVFPVGTTSLLCKNLSRDVWEQLKDKKDAHGVSFKQAILSGCQNVDSGIGVYAGSQDSYSTFGAIMDPIIEQYHGHKKGEKHDSDMDHTKLKCPPFAAEDAAMINSTRIRVGRNLANFPLGPGITREQRNEIEQKVVEACNKFDGELAGKFYSLSTMSEADREKLVADHFLFKEGDRFLEACGLNRNWPEGRGIFHNNDKTFLVWVNEEDQLRIISMQPGADIGAVFTRLAVACDAIEKVAKFAHDPSLGYITSCPTNLGTALRASVHIKLPCLGVKKDEFEAIAAKYHVQIRGIHGEHSESADHVYDISNKRRLGRSEVALVQDMYDGVKAMIEREKELAGPKVAADVQAGSHLKTPEDLTGYPVFPDGTKSLLCKNLTRDVWEQLKDKKDAHGVSFKQAILSGCQNVDSGIGVYAGSHDSYSTFGAIMDPIIEQYHGHKKGDKHESDMDHTKLNCPPFSAEDSAMINSTRIRVGRNLAEFPLGPGITKEQRNEIEQKVVEACNKFEGELAGKFYSLSTMSEADREALVADHFLFKEGDRFLEACGLNRNWPEGRGIFHNNEKTFLVWVNEEDQLRIISMQPGADIGAVFTRLSNACSAIEKVAKFSHDPSLGYITSCPTNLGTALRASVHIKLPCLGVKKEEFEAIADKFHVQIRGIHGEHSESADHVYDISNKRRLGRSEVALVQDMYDGVKAMIEREKELAGPKAAAGGDDIKAGSHLKTPEDLTGYPVFPEGTTSLLSKNLTRSVWDQLKDSKDAHGVSFKQAILSGCQNVDSGIGVYAGSHDSYTAFGAIMDPIIEQYHGHKKGEKHDSDMDHTKLKCPPFSEADAAMINSTRIRVGRNLAEFPLGPGITKEQRDEIEKKVVEACNSFEGELAGKYYSLATMSEADREALVADHFLFKEGDRFLEACGLNRDWPAGRGIFHNNEKSFLVWVNEEDQLRIISMQPGADIGAVFTRLSNACTAIEKVAKFAHDPSLGYITSCPTNLGTALRASVHIKLPCLGVKKDEFEAIAAKYHVQIRGIHGEHSESADHVYDISNKRRLGRSEVALVQDMYDGVKAMIEREKELAGSTEEKKQDDTVNAGSHLKLPTDLTGYPVFPDGTKSLLCKNLSKDVWNKYKDAKDSCGFTFKQAILSGCQNVDSGIGVYAGSHDSYTAFEDLFDPVIEQYHGHKKTDKHESDMDHTKLQCPPFAEDEDCMIVSTRIRVGRNLADLPLGPGLTREQRQEVEKKVVEACNSFEGELAGKFYSLATMSEADREALVAEHFLFKEGDRFLEACGLNREWPEGRGIFHNNDKTFLVWVNEEDQLRIIAMQAGADIGAVFTRLSNACTAIEKVAKFSHDAHLGYITSCPTNLGTALRASVHIKLPCLGAKKEEFEAIASEFNVQIRGIHGEHSESADHVYDISNRRRLGRSEVDLVQDMYNGVKAMIKREKELAATTQ